MAYNVIWNIIVQVILCRHWPQSQLQAPSEISSKLPRPRIQQAWPSSGELCAWRSARLGGIFGWGKLPKRRLRAGVWTVTRPALSPLDCLTILKLPTERPDHEVNVNVPSSLSPPFPPFFSSISLASTSTRLNPRRCLQSSVSSRSHYLRLAWCCPPSKQPFSPNDWVKPTLDGAVFLLDNDTPAEPIH